MKIENKIDSSPKLILPKDIQNTVPYSDKVDSRTFSGLLDDNRVVASYKMYWLLGILDETSAGNIEMDFEKIIARMIAYAWYPILQYKLSFGRFDNLKKNSELCSRKGRFSF